MDIGQKYFKYMFKIKTSTELPQVDDKLALKSNLYTCKRQSFGFFFLRERRSRDVIEKSEDDFVEPVVHVKFPSRVTSPRY